MSDKYILGPDHEAIPEPDLMTWASWFETADRVVARTTLADGQIEVSTVFIGLDHAFGGPVPLLFESLVFYYGPHDEPGKTGEQERYSTWDEAEAGHLRIVQQIRDSFTVAQP